MQGFALQDIVDFYKPGSGCLEMDIFVVRLDKAVNALFPSPLLPFLISSSALLVYYIFCIAELCKVMY